ncbi:Hypothetical predicted protein [Pelobates cultripes]|uniref:Fucolectin tachylectin-4 pentraxin-1 domain-containing protein n=1 Tax=Pelobates cultripes TaxID=61616 RepID=A0AAD1R8Y6_PELCU|nr:Hypothetical predicted protein [Pelobates cultripes]
MAYLLTIALLWMISSTAAQDNDQYKNIALRGRATQSSVYSYLNVAINAIDGNQDPNFYHGSCSCTNADVSPWWRVDLLSEYKISKIVITNRGDCCGERLDGAMILIGDSLENNGNNNPSCAVVTYLPNAATQSFQCNGMTGRYVNIVLPGKQTYLQLCEVQMISKLSSLMDCIATTVLEYRPNSAIKLMSFLRVIAHHSQSLESSSIYSHLNVAINAIDGNLDSNFNHGSCSCTTIEMSPWWRVDLLTSYQISEIVITNRGDCCGQRLNGALILVGDSPENNGNNNPRALQVKCAVVTYTPNVNTLKFQCNGMTGRYVNVIISGRAEYLQLCEVQVFGAPVSNTGHVCF